MPYPLTYWTLEYRPVSPTTAGTEQTLAALSIQEMKLNFISQSMDTCDFSIASSNVDDPIEFAYKSTCVIRSGRSQPPTGGPFSGGQVEFSGLVIETPRMAQGAKERISYKLAGPWWYLINRTFELQYLILQSWAPPAAPVYRTDSSGHLWLNRDINRNWLCTGEQAQAAVQWAISHGAPIQMLPNVAVALNPGITAPLGRTVQISAGLQTMASDVPIDEVVDATCAEVVTKMIRWNPDAVCWFDYTTVDTTPAGVPTFHCVRYTGLVAASLPMLGANTPGGVQMTDAGINPRYDLLRPFVEINFETTNSINGTEEFNNTKVTYPLGAPDTGINSFAGLVTTVRLQGATLNIVTAFVETLPIPSLTDTAGLANMLAVFNPWLNGLTVQSFEVLLTDPQNNNPLAPTREYQGATPLVFYVNPGSCQITDWMNASTAKDTIKGVYVHWRGVDGSDHIKEMPVEFVATNLNTGGVVQIFTKSTGTPFAEQIPVNLSQQIYDALSFLQYSGGVTWKGREADTTTVRIGNLFSISDVPQFAGMNAVVQEMTVDVDTGKTSIRFGPNKILEAGQYVELLRMTRNRLVLTDPGTRNATLNDDGSSTNIGKSTPVKNSTIGGGISSTIVASQQTDQNGNQIILNTKDTLNQFIMQHAGDGLVFLDYATARNLLPSGNQIMFRAMSVCVLQPDGTNKTMTVIVPCSMPF